MMFTPPAMVIMVSIKVPGPALHSPYSPKERAKYTVQEPASAAVSSSAASLLRISVSRGCASMFRISAIRWMLVGMPA